MQQVFRAALCCAAAVALASGAAESTASPMGSPIAQVVMLLKGLQGQIEKEGKTEETLYEKFVCWGKNVIKQKKESNVQAEKELQEVNQYISDLMSGRIELTTERVDLEKEIAEITQSMETAQATRDKEHADWEGATDEMAKAIAALGNAIQVLETATKDHKEGVLMATASEVNGLSSSAAAESASMSLAVQLGDKFLSSGDAIFLRRLLTGEVPEADWKKLNRKATFKMSYKARSGKIQETLNELKETFEKNKEQADNKETEAEETHTKLMGSKDTEKKAAQEALMQMDKESGAKMMSKEEAVARAQELSIQIGNDEKFIKQVEKQLAEKRVEWADRSTLRAGEIKAVSEAIYILGNDDAKDTFKKSLASQGYLFLQTSQTSKAKLSKEAAAALRRAAELSRDSRLTMLAAQVAREDPSAWTGFDPVIKSIDKMLETIAAEEANDSKKKETCEEDRMSDTREAVKMSRSVDEYSDKISAAKDAIEQVEGKVAVTEENLAHLKEQMEAAAKQRAEENAAFKTSKKDDEDAADMVKQAEEVLAKFYKDNKLMLAQTKGKEPVPVSAGEAPPPPPKTWEDPYGGKTGESVGLIAILSMIHEDILHDAAKAEAAEKKAQECYDDALKMSEADEKAMGEMLLELSKEKGSHETDKGDATRLRKTEKEGLDGILATIASKEPGCNYFTVNYNVRSQNRHIEMDGLTKAKAILQGAVFDAPDPNREIVPGDALLQRVHRH